MSVRQEDGRISDFSARCGIAADYCLAAPGEGVRVAYFGPDKDGNPGARGAVTRSGTSLAAPMVTGGLALVQHYFRDQLSGTEVLSRLLETADRGGVYADAEIYGRGLMDLGAATSPVGEPAIALGDRAGERNAVLRETGLWLGPAFDLAPPGASLGFRAGWMGERQTLLGTVPDGAFGDLRANAVFAGIDLDAQLGPWRMGARAEVGAVDTQVHNGLLADVSPLTTSAFGFRAVRRISRRSTFHASLSQPLRVERVRAQLSVPAGRTKSGEVIRNAVYASLAPTGRQVDLALQWRQTLRLGVLRLGATLSREPGHRKNGEPELVLLSSWRIPL